MWRWRAATSQMGLRLPTNELMRTHAEFSAATFQTENAILSGQRSPGYRLIPSGTAFARPTLSNSRLLPIELASRYHTSHAGEVQ